MSTLEIARMRELPLLIQRTRSSSRKLRFARELRLLTEQYKMVRTGTASRQASVLCATPEPSM